MSEMTEASEKELTPAARMGKAIGRGIIIGLPVTFVLMTLGVWVITDLDLKDSFVTAALPSVLLGVFGGGFAGMAATMDD